MKLIAECTMELFAGFFGINENGDQPECGFTVEINVDNDDESLTESIRSPGFVFYDSYVTCPKCGGIIEPQEWEIAQ